MNTSGLVLLLGIGLLVVVALALLLPMQRSRARDRSSTGRQVSGIIFRDDDRYWYGFFYINRDDPELLVPKRYGLGWTINFGHPKSKWLLLGLLLLIVLPPLVTGVFGGSLHSYGCHLSGCH